MSDEPEKKVVKIVLPSDAPPPPEGTIKERLEKLKDGADFDKWVQQNRDLVYSTLLKDELNSGRGVVTRESVIADLLDETGLRNLSRRDVLLALALRLQCPKCGEHYPLDVVKRDCADETYRKLLDVYIHGKRKKGRK